MHEELLRREGFGGLSGLHGVEGGGEIEVVGFEDRGVLGVRDEVCNQGCDVFAQRMGGAMGEYDEMRTKVWRRHCCMYLVPMVVLARNEIWTSEVVQLVPTVESPCE